MDVNQPVSIGIYEFWTQNLHVFRQHSQVYAVRVEEIKLSFFRLRLILAVHKNMFEWDFKSVGYVAKVFMVADNHRNFNRKFSINRA